MSYTSTGLDRAATRPAHTTLRGIVVMAMLVFGLTAGSMASSDEKPAPANIELILAHYLKVHAALAADSTIGTQDAARALAEVASANPAEIPPEIATAATKLADSADLAATREAFKVLSKSLSRHLSINKIKTGRYYQMYCSMANAGWIQADKIVKNPYHGKSMPSCGEVMGSY